MKRYGDGILIVILIEILHDYLFYLALAGNNWPFRVTPFTSSGYLGKPALTAVFVFSIFFLFLCPSVCLCHSVFVSGLCICYSYSQVFKREPGSWVRYLKSVYCLSKCLGALPKIVGEVLVTGLGRKQPLQQLKLLLLL